jgi:integrase
MDTLSLGPDGELRYSPVIPLGDWELVRPFVQETLIATRGKTPYSDPDLALVVTRLALWCAKVAHTPLTHEKVFTRHSIDRFIQLGLTHYTEGARANLRSQLLRVAESVADSRTAPRKLLPMRAALPSVPYSHDEIVSLRSWAATQSTPARRANAWVLLGLGLGAGLSAAEIGELKVGDITAEDWGVEIRVTSGRPRTVPVRRLWEPGLRERRATLTADRFAFREGHTQAYDNLISNFVARSKHTGVRPQSQRMRATWLVDHLNLGTPVAALIEAAGVDSLESFTRYLGFVHRPSGEEYRDVLAGPAPPTR